MPNNKDNNIRVHKIITKIFEDVKTELKLIDSGYKADDATQLAALNAAIAKVESELTDRLDQIDTTALTALELKLGI